MLSGISVVLIFGALQAPADAQQEKVPAKELLEYVNHAKKAGLQDAQIQQAAVTAGWASADVLEAISEGRTTPATPSSEKPTNAVTPARTAAAATPSITPATAAAAPAAMFEMPAHSLTTPGTPANTLMQPVAPPANSAASAPPVKPATINRGVPDEYRIGEGDVLQVSVWAEPTASVGSVVVRPDGQITIPLVKNIIVAGLTPSEAEKLITERLSVAINAPDVTVIVSQINSKKIFLVGAIRKEGTISYTYRMTIMQAISEAGGLTDYAKRKKIYVLRNENGRQYRLPFDYDAVLKGQHMELNIPLQPGDTLVVPH